MTKYKKFSLAIQDRLSTFSQETINNPEQEMKRMNRNERTSTSNDPRYDAAEEKRDCKRKVKITVLLDSQGKGFSKHLSSKAETGDI